MTSAANHERPVPPRVAFLLGAGVSLPAGMASTGDITDRVLSGQGVARHTDDRYYLGAPMYAHAGFPDEHVPRIVPLLAILKARIDNYYGDPSVRPTNYEDLYYMVEQVHSCELHEYDNPAVRPLCLDLRASIDPELLAPDTLGHQWQFDELCTEAAKYIRDVVWLMLCAPPRQTNHLGCLTGACDDNGVEHVDIFTLNHDPLIEQVLASANIGLADGFAPVADGTSVWSPTNFDRGAARVHLFKLHGSVDWFEYRLDSQDPWYADSIRKVRLGTDIEHLKDAHGNELTLIGEFGPRPLLLVGRFNKMFEYVGRGIFTELHNRFYQGLARTKALVVSGYSFGDRGINTRIIEWVYSSRDNRIVLIDPDPNALRGRARGAISGKWESWVQARTLKILTGGIQDVTWQDVVKALQ